MESPEYTFSQEEIEQIEKYRDKQPDARLKVRFIALLMIAKGSEIHFVAHVIGYSLQTIEIWIYQYKSKGLDALNSFQYKPKKPYLTPEQIEQLVDWVRTENPEKIKMVRAYIKENFNIKYCNEAVRQLLKKKGLELLRPKVRPGKAPTQEEQKETINQYFAMKKNYPTGTVFLFGDGMHLVHQNIPGLCWGDPKSPPVLRTNTGRKRLNILGAYNPDSHKLTHLTGEQNCDAERAIEFFNVIQEDYPKAPKIVLFLDNATYFKAKIVQEWLEKNPRFEIVYLPPYSPNLNLIERLWRFVKEKLVKNKYYEKYITFRAKSFQLLNHLYKHKEELRTLMVEKFQIV